MEEAEEAGEVAPEEEESWCTLGSTPGAVAADASSGSSMERTGRPRWGAAGGRGVRAGCGRGRRPGVGPTLALSGNLGTAGVTAVCSPAGGPERNATATLEYGAVGAGVREAARSERPNDSNDTLILTSQRTMESVGKEFETRPLDDVTGPVFVLLGNATQSPEAPPRAVAPASPPTTSARSPPRP